MKSDKSFLEFLKSGGLAKIIPFLILGAVLIIFGSSMGDTSEQAVSVGAEADLADTIASIEGVGRCKVMINQDGDGEICAVAVLCDGAESAKVRARVVSLLRSLYGIGSNRISVLPYGGA